MVLLLGGVNYDNINILGRWCSNDMMMYLHTFTHPLMQAFAATMATHSNYDKIPNDLGAKIDGDGNA